MEFVQNERVPTSSHQGMRPFDIQTLALKAVGIN